MSHRTAYAAGNWKMHGLSGDLSEVAKVARAAEGGASLKAADFVPIIKALATSKGGT